MLRRRGRSEINVLYSDGSSKWLALGMVSAEMLNGKLLSTQAAVIKRLYFKNDVIEIINGKLWQN
jgi:hypothetical protein